MKMLALVASGAAIASSVGVSVMTSVNARRESDIAEENAERKRKLSDARYRALQDRTDSRMARVNEFARSRNSKTNVRVTTVAHRARARNAETNIRVKTLSGLADAAQSRLSGIDQSIAELVPIKTGQGTLIGQGQEMRKTLQSVKSDVSGLRTDVDAQGKSLGRVSSTVSKVVKFNAAIQSRVAANERLAQIETEKAERSRIEQRKLAEETRLAAIKTAEERAEMVRVAAENKREDAARDAAAMEKEEVEKAKRIKFEADRRAAIKEAEELRLANQAQLDEDRVAMRAEAERKRAETDKRTQENAEEHLRLVHANSSLILKSASEEAEILIRRAEVKLALETAKADAVREKEIRSAEAAAAKAKAEIELTKQQTILNDKIESENAKAKENAKTLQDALAAAQAKGDAAAEKEKARQDEWTIKMQDLRERREKNDQEAVAKAAEVVRKEEARRKAWDVKADQELAELRQRTLAELNDAHQAQVDRDRTTWEKKVQQEKADWDARVKRREEEWAQRLKRFNNASDAEKAEMNLEKQEWEKKMEREENDWKETMDREKRDWDESMQRQKIEWQRQTKAEEAKWDVKTKAERAELDRAKKDWEKKMDQEEKLWNEKMQREKAAWDKQIAEAPSPSPSPSPPKKDSENKAREDAVKDKAALDASTEVPVEWDELDGDLDKLDADQTHLYGTSDEGVWFAKIEPFAQIEPFAISRYHKNEMRGVTSVAADLGSVCVSQGAQNNVLCTKTFSDKAKFSRSKNGTAENISMSGKRVCGVRDGDVWCTTNYDTANWSERKIPSETVGTAKDVAIEGTRACVAGSEGLACTHNIDASNPTYPMSFPGRRLDQIALTGNRVCGVSGDNLLYCKDLAVPGKNDWFRISGNKKGDKNGKLKNVATNANNVFGIGMEGQIARTAKATSPDEAERQKQERERVRKEAAEKERKRAEELAANAALDRAAFNASKEVAVNWGHVDGDLYKLDADQTHLYGISDEGAWFAEYGNYKKYHRNDSTKGATSIAADHKRVCISKAPNNKVLCTDVFSDKAVFKASKNGQAANLSMSGHRVCGVKDGGVSCTKNYKTDNWSKRSVPTETVGTVKDIAIDGIRACVAGTEGLACTGNIDNPQYPTKYPGRRLDQISLTGTRVCGVSGDNHLYCKDTDKPGDKWFRTSGSKRDAGLKNVATHGKHVFRVEMNGKLSRTDQPTSPEEAERQKQERERVRKEAAEKERKRAEELAANAALDRAAFNASKEVAVNWGHVDGDLYKLDADQTHLYGISDEGAWFAEYGNYKKYHRNNSTKGATSIAADHKRVCISKAPNNKVLCTDVFSDKAVFKASKNGQAANLSMSGHRVCGVKDGGVSCTKNYKTDNWSKRSVPTETVGTVKDVAIDGIRACVAGTEGLACTGNIDNPQYPTKYPGRRLDQISLTGTRVCGVSGDNHLYCKDTDKPGDKWFRTSGSKRDAGLKNVATHGKHVFRVEMNGKLSRTDQPTSPEEAARQNQARQKNKALDDAAVKQSKQVSANWTELGGDLDKLDADQTHLYGTSDEGVWFAKIIEPFATIEPFAISRYHLNETSGAHGATSVTADEGRVCISKKGENNKILCTDDFSDKAVFKGVKDGQRAENISMSGSRVCGVGDGEVYCTTNYATVPWKKQQTLPSDRIGVAKDVAIEKNRACVAGSKGVACTGNIDDPNYTVFDGRRLDQIALTGNRVCGVSGDNLLYCKDLDKSNDKWFRVSAKSSRNGSGKVKSLAMHGDDVFRIGTPGDLARTSHPKSPEETARQKQAQQQAQKEAAEAEAKAKETRTNVTWKEHPKGKNFTQIDADRTHVFGRRGDGVWFAKYGNYGTWHQNTNSAAASSMAADGYNHVCISKGDNNAVLCTKKFSEGAKFTYAKGNARNISMSGNRVCGIGNGGVWCTPNYETVKWTKKYVPASVGTPQDVAVAGNRACVSGSKGVACTGNVDVARPNYPTATTYPGKLLKKISVTDDRVCGVDSNNVLHCRDLQGSYDWFQTSGKIKTLATSGDRVFGVNMGNKLVETPKPKATISPANQAKADRAKAEAKAEADLERARLQAADAKKNAEDLAEIARQKEQEIARKKAAVERAETSKSEAQQKLGPATKTASQRRTVFNQKNQAYESALTEKDEAAKQAQREQAQNKAANIVRMQWGKGKVDSALLTKLDADNTHLFGIRPDKGVYFAKFDKYDNWHLNTSTHGATSMTADGNNRVCITKDNKVSCTPKFGKDAKFTSAMNGKAHNISLSGNRLCGVAQGQMWCTSNYSNAKWEQKSVPSAVGTVRDVGVSGYRACVAGTKGVACTGNIDPKTPNFKNYPGQILDQISLAGARVCGVSADNVMHCNDTGTSKGWFNTNGVFTNVATHGNNVFGLAKADGEVYRVDKPNAPAVIKPLATAGQERKSAAEQSASKAQSELGAAKKQFETAQKANDNVVAKYRDALAEVKSATQAHEQSKIQWTTAVNAAKEAAKEAETLESVFDQMRTSEGWVNRPIKLSSSNLCLDDPGQGGVNGKKVHVWACHGKDNQKWSYDSDTGQVKLKKGNGKMCLDLPGGNQNNGSKLQVWTCSKNHNNQKWEVIDDKIIRKPGTNKCVGVSSGIRKNGMGVELRDCNDSDSQSWAL